MYVYKLISFSTFDFILNPASDTLTTYLTLYELRAFDVSRPLLLANI